MKYLGVLGAILAISMVSEGAASGAAGSFQARLLQECKLMVSGLSLFFFDFSFLNQINFMGIARIAVFFFMIWTFVRVALMYYSLRGDWRVFRQDGFKSTFLIMEDEPKSRKID